MMRIFRVVLRVWHNSRLGFIFVSICRWFYLFMRKLFTAPHRAAYQRFSWYQRWNNIAVLRRLHIPLFPLAAVISTTFVGVLFSCRSTPCPTSRTYRILAMIQTMRVCKSMPCPCLLRSQPLLDKINVVASSTTATSRTAFSASSMRVRRGSVNFSIRFNFFNDQAL